MTVDGDRWSDIYYEDIRCSGSYPQDNQATGNTGGTGLENRRPAPGLGENRPAAAGTQRNPAAYRLPERKEATMTTIEALEQEPFLWDYLPRVEKPIVLYGMGNGADAILDRCAALGIPVAGVFASDEFVRGQEFRGYKVKTYKEMKAELGSFVILIAFASERPEILRRFFHLAREQETYAPHLPLFGDSRVVTPGWIRENRGVLERVCEKLADDASRQVMEDILRYKLTGKLEYLARTTDRRQDLETLFSFGEEESYGDLGAYNGDTLREFLELTGGHYDHLYGVEPDPKNFAKLQKFVEEEQLGRCTLVPDGIWPSRRRCPLRPGAAGCLPWNRGEKKR